MALYVQLLLPPLLLLPGTAETQQQPEAAAELPARLLPVVAAAAAAAESSHEAAAAAAAGAAEVAVGQVDSNHDAAASTREATDGDGHVNHGIGNIVDNVSAGDGTTAAAAEGRSGSPAPGRVPPSRIPAGDLPDLQVRLLGPCGAPVGLLCPGRRHKWWQMRGQ